MGLVSVYDEWSALEEVIVGTARGAQIPKADHSLLAIDYADMDHKSDVPSGRFDTRVIEQTELELDILAEVLRGLGVTVRRPQSRDLTATVSTPDWSTDGYHDYCPRDGLLAVGETIIETPMALRSRIFEGLAYKEILLECFRSGSTWLSAPRPRLLDSAFDVTASPGSRLLEAEPIFDAANVLRFGSDILYLKSDSGNELGARWLQQVLGPQFAVHVCRNLYASTHVDSTIVPLRPGLVLINPSRVNSGNLPPFLKSWDQIICPDLVDIGFMGDRAACSVWIGMNLLVVNPDLVIVDDRQLKLARAIENAGISVLPLRLTHARTLSGGFHCATLDLRRSGGLDSYI